MSEEKLVTKKPKWNKDCLVITANKIIGEWDYAMYQIKKLHSDEGSYWGWLTSDGEEYGDIEDLIAQKYLILEPLN